MLALHNYMRAGARRLGMGTLLLLPLAACAGGDLLLPEDRTPVQLRALSGNGQAAPVGSRVPNPLVVEALDRAERPVQGAVIVFRFVDPPDGAAIAPAVSETDPEGLASVEVTLGTPAGDQTVEARLDDSSRELSVRFLLTAIRSNGGGGDDDDDPMTGTVEVRTTRAVEVAMVGKAAVVMTTETAVAMVRVKAEVGTMSAVATMTMMTIETATATMTECGRASGADRIVRDQSGVAS
jgi:hypothetical protein